MNEALNYFDTLEKRISFLEEQLTGRAESIPVQPQQSILTIEELVKYIGNVPKGTVYQWMHKGYIPSYKVGRRVYFKRETIDEWLQNRKRKTLSERVDEIRAKK